MAGRSRRRVQVSEPEVRAGVPGLRGARDGTGSVAGGEEGGRDEATRGAARYIPARQGRDKAGEAWVTLQVGHRVVLRDGGEWSILSVNRKHRLVRLGDRLYRPQELRVVSFAEIFEIAGWDRGDGTTSPIGEEEETGA